MISQTHINSKPPGDDRLRSRLLSPGFTLVELLVAIGLLAVLGTLLIMTFTDSLSLWSQGETQRKRYEEAHFILRKLTNDLRQAWVPLDDRSRSGVSADSLRPFLQAGINTPDNAPFRGRWLDMIRTKPGYITGGDSLSTGDRFQRRVYVLLPGEGLFRGTAPADESFPHHKNIGLLSEPNHVREQFELVGSNVLYVDFRFWGPWMDLEKLMESKEGFSISNRWPANLGGQGNHVSLVWDSSRRESGFRMFNKQADLPAVPAMVRVRVELTPDERISWPRLTSSLSSDADEGTPVPIERGADVPSTGYIHVGEEWIRVTSDNGTMTIEARGVRGTEAADHDAGDRVRAGNGFETTVYLPVYPGRQYYLDRLKRSRSDGE